MNKLDLSEGSSAHKSVSRFESDVLDEFQAIFEHCSESDFGDGLSDILKNAINLDMELSRQVAKYSWVFETGEFDTSTMDLVGDYKPGEKDIQLIVAPGVKKRGKSTGEDFNVEIPLLLTQVYYVATTKSQHNPEVDDKASWGKTVMRTLLS